MTSALATPSPHVPVRPEWLATTVEPALDPALPIIDAHHHLWDRPEHRYLLPELLADTATGHNIEGTIYVQARSMYRADGPEALRPVGEVEFANCAAAQSASGIYGPTQACAGIVAFADLRLGDAAQTVLEAVVAAGNGRVRGIRNTTAAHPDPTIRSNPQPPPEGVLLEPGFRRGTALVGQMGLSLDVWAYHTQLAEVAALARACPQTPMVVDHCGGPLGVGPFRDKRTEVFRQWRASMATLAGLPNVAVKLGGLAMRVGGFDFDEQERAPTSIELAEAWRPYVHSLIELFGAGRCMFESNFPVDKGMCSYGVLWNAFKRLAAHASAEERTALFSGTARRVYCLPHPGEVDDIASPGREPGGRPR